jgi:hypothetical protein
MISSVPAAAPYRRWSLSDPRSNRPTPEGPRYSQINSTCPAVSVVNSYRTVLLIRIAAEAATVTVSQNVTLNAAGGRTISGRILNEASGTVIPGAELFVESDAGQVTLVFSDATGNFTAPVSPSLLQQFYRVRVGN